MKFQALCLQCFGTQTLKLFQCPVKNGAKRTIWTSHEHAIRVPQISEKCTLGTILAVLDYLSVTKRRNQVGRDLKILAAAAVVAALFDVVLKPEVASRRNLFLEAVGYLTFL